VPEEYSMILSLERHILAQLMSWSGRETERHNQQTTEKEENQVRNEICSSLRHLGNDLKRDIELDEIIDGHDHG
jgi:hypothetical protein